VHVRDANEDDARALSTLWFDLVARPGSDASAGDSPEMIVAKAVLRVAEDDTGRIIVAEIDGAVVGCGFMRVGIASPLDQGRVVHLSHVQVSPGFRRQGVGSALVEATLTWAEERGIESVVTSVPQTHREANRFLARLGMAPVAALRGGSVAALRSRLPHDPSVVARQTSRMGRNVGQVVAARRSQRRARSRAQSQAQSQSQAQGAVTLADGTVGAAD
jgi:GNAT superfamily N-acetyltransferase